MSTYIGSKVWKERPPGPEQILLDEMFENGSITASATPESVRQSSDLFKQFSAKVFAAHYRKTKGRLGEFISNHIRGLPGGVIPPSPSATKDRPTGALGLIPELGTYDARHIPKRARPDLDQIEKVAPAEISNLPYTVWRYKDYTMKNEYVCVSINTFTGCKTVTFDVDEDGMKIIVRFCWASAIHNAEQMFNESIRAGQITLDHPILHAMSSQYLDAGITVKSNPEVVWTIPLPCKVRREISSYSMKKLTYENTSMVFIKLSALQNDVIIEQHDRTLSLE